MSMIPEEIALQLVLKAIDKEIQGSKNSKIISIDNDNNYYCDPEKIAEFYNTVLKTITSGYQ